MTPPIRGDVHAVTEYPKEPEEMTLREALEWWKKAVSFLDGIVLNPMETKWLNQRWVTLVGAIAEREGVPTGSLSYYLAELASAEIRLAQEAELESQAANML